MPKYISRKIVKQILGAHADQFDVILLFGDPLETKPIEPYGQSVVQEMYDKARAFRAYCSEDEGVTYP